MQDDEVEWRYEASRMHDIYRGRYLTIAASDAHDDSGGCLFDDETEKANTDPAVPRVRGRGGKIFPGKPFLARIQDGDTRG